MPVQNPFSLQFNGNITEWNSVALGNPTAWGTAPTAQVVIGVNAEMFAGTTALTATGSSLNVNITGGTFGGTLSNNTAAPAATNLGVLPAIAETAYNTVTYTTGNQVLPVTDLHGALNQDLQAYAGTQLTGTVTAYGTAPTGNVFGVNAFITNTPAVTVSGTVAVTQSTSPWVVSLASTTITGTVTAVGNLTNNNAAPTATLQGVLPAIAETAYTTVTYTTGDMVLPVTDLHGALNQDLQAYAGTQLTGTVTAYGTAPTGNVFGVNAFITNTVPVTLTSTTITGTVAVTQSTSPWVVAGNLTNNNAAPAATNLGVLGFIAETAWTTATYTTGNQVLATTDTHGAVWTDLGAVAGTAVVTAAAGIQKVGISGATGATVDAASTQNVATPTNGILILGEFNTTPTTITTGNSSPLQMTAAGGVRVAISGSASATMDAVITAATAPANGLAALSVYQATQPSLTTGQSVALQNDSAGNLQISYGCNVTTGATLPVALNSTQYITGTATIGAPIGKPAVIIQLDQTTTITAGAVTFEGTYDGTNWVTIPVAQVVHPETFALLTNPYTLVASTNQPFMILMQGYQNVRIRVSTAITGTGTVTPYWDSRNHAPLQAINVTANPSGGTSVATGSIGATKTAIKTSAGAVYGWYFYNSNSSVVYVQMFANTVAGVTLGTTAPTMSLGIPPGSAANMAFDTGVSYATAITIAITTTRAGATGPTNTVDYNVLYL